MHLILGEVDGYVLEYLFFLVKIAFVYILFQFACCWFLILLILGSSIDMAFGDGILGLGIIYGSGDAAIGYWTPLVSMGRLLVEGGGGRIMDYRIV